MSTDKKGGLTGPEQFVQMPEKSLKQAQKAWVDLSNFLANGAGTERKPTTEEYLTYFDFLRIVKGHKGSTMWSIFNQINQVHFQLYGQKLGEESPVVLSTLKSYNKKEDAKRAAVFTTADINRFLFEEDLVPNERYWLVRKAYVIVAFFGGLRCVEMHNLDMDDMAEDPTRGIHVTVKRAKQGGKSSFSKFLVPKAKEGSMNSDYAGLLMRYLEALKSDTRETSGPLFRSATKHNQGGGKLSLSPLGSNAMGYIGIEVATVLQLNDPHLYTGYSFRRSALTQALVNGASPQDLKSLFDIHSWQQLQTYASESQKYSKPTDSIFMTENQLIEAAEPEKRRETASGLVVENLAPSPDVKARVEAEELKKRQLAMACPKENVESKKIKLNPSVKEKKVIYVTSPSSSLSCGTSRIPRKPHKKRSNVLTRDQVDKFLSDESFNQCKTTMSQKVLIIFSYIYGLSFRDIRDLKVEDLVRLNKHDGEIFVLLKQWSAEHLAFVETRISIGKLHSDIITKYVDMIYEDTEGKLGYGYLMRTIHGYKFTDKRMGINAMFGTGAVIAKLLKLDNPETYGSLPPGKKNKLEQRPTSNEGQSTLAEVVSAVPSFQSFNSSSNTEYVTFQYQTEPPYFDANGSCNGSTFNDLAIGQTVTYEIPVQSGGPSSTFVQLHVVDQPQQVQVIAQTPEDAPIYLEMPQAAISVGDKSNQEKMAEMLSSSTPNNQQTSPSNSHAISVSQYAAKVIKETQNYQKEKSLGKNQRSFVVLPNSERKVEVNGLHAKFLKAWKDFTDFLRHNEKPEKSDYLNYFAHLKSVKGSKGQFLWTTFNRLQQMHHKYYKENLRAMPELQELSKTFRNAESDTLASKSFELSDIYALLLDQSLDMDKYWLSRKAFVVVSHFGRLRCAEVRKLRLQDLINTEEGILVKLADKAEFLVPKKAIENSNVSFSSILAKYYDSVIVDTKQTRGALFRHFFKPSGNFTRIPMGVTVMQQIRQEVASFLAKLSPHEYKEDCFHIQAT